MNKVDEMMNIILNVYQTIIENVPDCPPEVGGILGGNDNIIKYVKFDNGINYFKNKSCFYAPDVEKLNRYIEKWERKDVDFYGIFHTHFYGITTLSEGDKRYIKKIMNTLPIGVFKLYFPIVVLPERDIKVYIAYKQNEKVEIKKGRINILNAVD